MEFITTKSGARAVVYAGHKYILYIFGGVDEAAVAVGLSPQSMINRDQKIKELL